MFNQLDGLKLRKILLNKYAITLYVFAIIFTFLGDQSWIKQIARKREIKQTRLEISEVQKQTAISETLLNSLEHPDSLEKFARETYKMHASDEDVYIVQ